MIRGLDVSHWNNELNVRERLREDMDRFMIIKASEGATYRDIQRNNYAKIADEFGLVKGFYHYARPETNPVESEVRNFLDSIAGMEKHSLLALDWEGKALDCTGYWAKQWLDMVYKETGIKPLLYVQESALDKVAMCAEGDYGLWVAKWGSKKPNKGKWKVWAIWQCSDGHRLKSEHGCDSNYFNGSLEQLKKYTISVKE